MNTEKEMKDVKVTEEKKSETIKGFVIIGATALISYKLGARHNINQILKGFKVLNKVDPTLVPHIMETYYKYKRVQH